MDDGAPTDEQLAASFQSTGKMEFVDELLSRYVGKMCGMSDPMVPNLADAEDSTQEVLVRAGIGRHGRGHLLSWVQGSWLTGAGGRDEIVTGRRMKP